MGDMDKAQIEDDRSNALNGHTLVPSDGSDSKRWEQDEDARERTIAKAALSIAELGLWTRYPT